MHRKSLLTALTALVLTGAVTSAHAADIQVTTTDDVVANDGKCSLREAIQSANSNSAGSTNCAAGEASLDTVTVGGVTDILTLPANASDDDNLGGDLDIDTNGGPLTIVGGDNGTIRADQAANDSRVMDVRGPGTLTLSGVRVTGGNLQGQGGGLRILSSHVVLDDASVDNNRSTSFAPDFPSSGGGGIYIAGGSLDAKNNSTISGNTVQNGNAAADPVVGGGGLFVAGGSDVSIDETSLFGNNVSHPSGAETIAGGAIAAIGTGDDISISNSSITNSVVFRTAAGQAGSAIYWADDGTLSIENSTLSDNGQNDNNPSAAQIDATGGAVNVAATTFGGSAKQHGPSVASHGSAFTIRGSILSEGTGADGECQADPVTSAGYNVEAGPANDCGFAGTGDVVADPQLQPLGGNGSLNRNRLAIAPQVRGAVPAASCVGADGSTPLDRDQRGVPRDGNCDIGSVELDCGGVPATIVGTAAGEVIPGTSGDDSIVALGGDDTVNAGDGNDHVCGGDGADTLNGEGGDDTILPAADQALDTVNGGDGVNTVSYQDYNPSVSNGLTIDLSTGKGPANDSFTNIQNATGSLNGDVLAGDSGDNVLDGFGGSDRVSYRTATDPVTIDLPGGTATGGGGSDTLISIEGGEGGQGDDTFIPDEHNNIFFCTGGADTFDYSDVPAGAGGIHADLGYDFPELITGPATGVDTVGTPITCFNNVIGTPNDDVIIGTREDNVVDGGDGNDTFSFLSAFGVTASLVTHTSDPTSGNPLDSGHDVFNDVENLDGSPQDDTLIGDNSDNVLDGAGGDDQITGAGGNDTVKFAFGTGSTNASLATGSSTQQGGGIFDGVGNDHFTGMENMIGSPGADILEGDDGDNHLDGNGGDDTLSYANAGGAVNVDLGAGTTTGTAGNDTLLQFHNAVGGAGADTIAGDSEQNVLEGGGGNDLLDGRGADDTLFGNGGTNSAGFGSLPDAVHVSLPEGIAEGQGHDVLQGIQGVVGSSADDTVVADEFSNPIDGGAGRDLVSFQASAAPVNANLGTQTATGAGSDTLTNVEDLLGTDQNDVLQGNSSNNDLNGAGGIDTASFSGGAPVTASLLSGTASGAGSDSLESIENLEGSTGNDSLTGDGGVNAVAGGAGDDTIDPGSGADIVDAGTGADQLLLRDGAVDTADCGADTVTDNVTADPRGTDVLTNCSAVDVLAFLGEAPVGGQPPGGTPTPKPGGNTTKPPRKCKKKKGKKGKKKACGKKKTKGKKKRK